MSLLDQPLCSFSSSALPFEPMLVVEWRGEEAISRPYRFEVKLASINPLLDDEAMLGQPATLSLTDAKGMAQPYHGIITEAELLDGDSQYFYFRVVLEPRMALLRQSRFSEIWLNKSLPDLIRAVLAEAALNIEGPGTSGAEADSYDFDIRLAQGDLALNESSFTCQFEETSFAFLSRLLEYYGVYYFFEQQDDHEALVFCGDQRYQSQTETLLNYRPLDTALDAGQGIALTRTFNRRLASQPKDVVVQDFSATNAQLQLKDSASIASASIAADADSEQSQAAANAPGFNGEQWLYGEHFGSNKEGQELAKLRAQALGCRHREFHGKGRAVGLRAGYPMRLLGHLRLTLNTQYQVIQVQHDGSQPLPGLGQDQAGTAGDINTRFIAIPGDVQFRPQRLTRKPRVQGLLSAIVDGDDTGQPLLNQHGCYKVIFPFIRGDKGATRGSAWLRMATMSSGANHGMHFPLLKGTEVLVSFLGGDPDRPVITGSVPNSENPNKVNEENATQSGLSTPGGHFMAMEDDPSGRKMKLGAPEGQTLFTMGNGRYSGADLSTNDHVNVASSSSQQQIGQQYKFVAGPVTGPAKSSAAEYKSPTEQLDEAITEAKKETKEAYDKYTEAQAENLKEPSEAHKKAEEDAKKNYEAAEQEEKKLKEEKHEEEESQAQITALLPKAEPIDTKWGNSGVWNLGAKMGWHNARTFTAELNTSVFMYECNAGLTKNEMSLYAVKNEVSATASTFEYKLGKFEYEYSNAHAKTTPIQVSSTLNHYIKTGSNIIEAAAISETTSPFIDLDAVEAINIKAAGGFHTISINTGGIQISSNLPILIKGDTQIEGELVVAGGLVVRDSISAQSVDAVEHVNALQVACSSLFSQESTTPMAYVPSPESYTAGIAASTAAFAAYEAVSAGLTAARTAARTVATASEHALEAMEAAEQVSKGVAVTALIASVLPGILAFEVAAGEQNKGESDAGEGANADASAGENKA